MKFSVFDGKLSFAYNEISILSFSCSQEPFNELALSKRRKVQIELAKFLNCTNFGFYEKVYLRIMDPDEIV